MGSKLDLPPPPTIQGRGGGGGSEWVELTKTANDIEAHLLTGRLNEAGVESLTVKDRAAPGAWLYGGSNPWAPVAVMVRPFQLQDARIVLAEISFSGPPAERAEEESAGRAWRSAVLWWVIAIALGILFTAVALVRTSQSLGRCEIPLLCEAGARTD